MSRESDIIDLIHKASCDIGPRPETAIGDDAAVVARADGGFDVLCMDTLNAGIHFPKGTHAADIAWKSLAVNFSDVAAMGGAPRTALLSLVLEEHDTAWVGDFAQGLREVLAAFDVALIGGDTSRGPLSISAQVTGHCERRPVLRSGGNAGDLLVVTGSLGGAAAALRAIQRQEEPGDMLADRLNRPVPRVYAAQLIAPVATACMDISDGLVVDLEKLAKASEVGFALDLRCVPCDPAIPAGVSAQDKQTLALHGGDDYELLFTIPSAKRPLLDEWRDRAQLDFTVLGHATQNMGLVWDNDPEKLAEPTNRAFDHFSVNCPDNPLND